MQAGKVAISIEGTQSSVGSRDAASNPIGELMGKRPDSQGSQEW